jgi:hypothetical protein
MRATVLLPISLLACGQTTNVDVAVKLAMSNDNKFWCGTTNNPRMDCPFQMGIYFLDATSDAGTKVLSTTCVSFDGKPGRTFNDIPQALDTAMAKTQYASSDTAQALQLQVAVIEPPNGSMCDHETPSPSFNGFSPVFLAADPSLKRVDVTLQCLRAFTDTATCLH